MDHRRSRPGRGSQGAHALIPMAPFRLVVLSSGTGTNLQNLIEHTGKTSGRIRIQAVFSDRRSRSLQRAKAAGIDAHHLAMEDFSSRSEFDAALGDAIEACQPDLIVLSGFMRVLGAAFVARFEGRIINLHPSLLPRYPGLHTHRRVLEAGDSYHGATVHFVTEALDAGPGIIQCGFPVDETDDEASLEARVHDVEYLIFPRAVEWCAEGRVRFAPGTATFDGMPLAGPVAVRYEG